jgi:hypothetical protein
MNPSASASPELHSGQLKKEEEKRDLQEDVKTGRTEVSSDDSRPKPTAF